jgi:enoyl-CoA hydratase
MFVKTEKVGAITTVILNRPEARNAVNRRVAEELAQAFRAFDADDDARVAVLWGRGGTFCAGADIKALADPELRNRADVRGDGPLGPTRMTVSKPTIAAVSGHAVAGGLELAIWCDLRVVERSAVFGEFGRRWGIPLIDGCTTRLPALIGMSRALDMILTGRPVPAEEAYGWGLANRLVDEGTSREEAEKLAREIASFPDTCMRMDRLSTYQSWGRTFEDALRNEFLNAITTITSPQLQEGVARFAGGKGRHGEFFD